MNETLVDGLIVDDKKKINCYEFKMYGICPNDENVIDEYNVKLTTDKMIMVESIQEFVLKNRSKVAYQEALATYIHDKYMCYTEVTGTHLCVKITTTIG